MRRPFPLQAWTVAAALVAASPVRAQTIAWANAGTDFGTTANWTGGVVPGSSNIAQFAAVSPVQPNLASALTVGGVQFASGAGAFTLSGSATLTLAGSLGIDNQSSSSSTQTVAVPLVFSAAVSTINNFQGTLVISGAVTNNTTSGLILDGATGTGTISGPISGGTLSKQGAGTWTLSGTNTYSGDTTVSQGTLALGNSLALQNSTLNYATGGTLSFGTLNAATLGGLSGAQNLALANTTPASVALTVGNNNANTTYSGILSGSGSLTKTGTGTLTLTGDSTFTGGTTISSGTLQLGSISSSGSVTGNVVDNGTLTFGHTNSYTFGGNISGTGLVRQTFGTLTLSGTNSHAGGTELSFGTLNVNSATALGTGVFQITGNANLGNSSGAPLTLSTNNAQTWTSKFSFVGPNDLNLGTGAITLANPNIAISANTGTLTIGGPIGENAAGRALQKTGAGTLVLSGASTFTGQFLISQGVVSVNALANGGVASPIGSSSNASNSLFIDTSGILRYTGPATSTDRLFRIGNDGTIEASGTGTLTFTNPGDLSFFSSATLFLSGTGNGTFAPRIVNGSEYTTSLTKSGTGTWTLFNGNIYSGTTTISGGTLADGAANAFSPNSAVSVASGATLAVGFNETIRGLNDVSGAGGSVTIASGKKLTVSVPSGSTTFSGVISGTNGALAVSSGSNGTVALTGTNTYTGGTTIDSSSNLVLGSPISDGGAASGSIPSGNIITNGALVFNRSTALSIGGISGTGWIAQSGTGTTTLTGSNSYSGGTMVFAGTLTDGGSAGAISPNSTASVASGATLTLTANESVRGLNDLSGGGGVVSLPNTGTTLTVTSGGSNFSGAIGGLGGLTVSGGAFLTLTGTNNYTGGTVINSSSPFQSVLQIGNGSAAGSAIAGNVANNGILIFYPKFSDSLIYGGVISGSGGLTFGQTGDVNPTGTLTLTGQNTYTGSTTMNAGTLVVGVTNALPPGTMLQFATSGSNSPHLDVAHNQTIARFGFGDQNATIQIDTGATFTVAPTSFGSAFGGTVTGPGNLAIAGAVSSSVTFTGTVSPGTITISGGTMQMGDGASSGSLTSNITDNGQLIFYPQTTGGNINYGGVVSGTGGLKMGPGGSTTSTASVTLTGQNTYTGGTIINSGTLGLGTTNALPTATTVTFFNNATLDVANDQTIARLNGFGTDGQIHLENGLTGGVLVPRVLTVAPQSAGTNSVFNGEIYGPGALVIGGVGGTSTALSGDSSFSGGTTVNPGATLLVGTFNGDPLGSGPLSLQNGAIFGGSGSTFSLNNAVTATGASVTFGAPTGGGDIGLTGAVSLTNAATTVHLTGDQALLLKGTLTVPANTILTFDSAGGGFGLAMLGASTVTGNISTLVANNAGVALGSSAALAAITTIQATSGYVSAMFPGSGFLGKIDTAHFTGTVGFDSSENGAATVFNDTINLTGFNSGVSLGSVSSAILTGPITPAGANYQFGNGGGALIVRSNLSLPIGVSVNSSTAVSGNALDVVFQGTNSYTGNLAITNSAGLLDSFNALPPGRTVSLGANSYLGYTESFTDAPNFASFASRLSTYTATSILGLDSHSWLADRIAGISNTAWLRSVPDSINLSGFGPIYLGTATNVELDGLIKAPATGVATKTLYLAALEKGNLTIASPLLAGNVDAVTVGMSSSPLTGSGKSAVELDAPNTYAGGTTLLSDALLISDNSRFNGSALVAGPLGTGTLTVPSNAVQPILAAADNYVPLKNAIALAGNLQLGRLRSGEGLEPDFNTLALNGVISGNGSLKILGDVELNGANSFTNGVFFNGGGLTLGNNSALGTGPLTVGPNGSAGGYWTNLYTNGPITVGNGVVLNGWFNVYPSGQLTVNGPVTLNSDTMIQNWEAPLVFNGAVSGQANLTFNGSGQLSLNGTNTYNRGTTVYSGAVIFGSAASIPANPAANVLLASGSGYIGAAFNTFAGGIQAAYVSRFDPTSSGTIGFDSPTISSPLTFGNPASDNIDLSNFHSGVRLGSASSAILAAKITPSGTNYSFGGGGGLLQVTSALVNQTALDSFSSYVSVFSPDSTRPLTLLLTGANTYSGGTSASNSAVVFGITTGGGTALSASGDLNLNTAGYMGLQLAADLPNTDSTTVPGFLTRFGIESTGFVGFDSADRNTVRTISADIDLVSPGRFLSGIYLATTTNLAVSGNLTFPTNVYRFTGYKGGQLAVNSLLSGARIVLVGGNTTVATAGDPSNPAAPLSTVALNNTNNSYSGGTTFYSGRLVVGSTGALGSGGLTVVGGISVANFDPTPRLEAGATNVSVANNITLNHDLNVGGFNNLTLSGAIAGFGELYKSDNGTLTLSGNNTFTGGIYIQQGNVTFASGSAAGTGPLSLGSTLSPSATFAVASPSIGTLSGDSVNDLLSLTAAVGALTINQGDDAVYLGAISGPAAIEVKLGQSSVTADMVGPLPPIDVRLRLTGASNYSGGTKIDSSVALIAAGPTVFNTPGVITSGIATGPLGTGAVTLNGGKLAVESGTTLFNTLTLTAGILGGSGAFSPLVAPVIGGSPTSPVILAPGGNSQTGFASVGNLTFGSGLTFAPGGTYNWQLQFANSAAGPGAGWDLITVSGTLLVTANSSQPFNFQLISLGPEGISGAVVDFNPANTYVWPVVQATNISGFNASAFAINDTLFRSANSGFANGQFFLTATSTAISLNFTPVPEPSTYALLLLGLGAVAFTVRRRTSR